MLGGLLEALFLARINRLTSLAPLFTAAAAPKDKAGKPRPLKEWGLKDYLDVEKELGWIRQSAKHVGQVLRDDRNYIHPEKELSHGITVVAEDTAMFVSVFSSIAEPKLRFAHVVNQLVDARRLSQPAVASVLKLTKSKVSALRRYKLAEFSVETLIGLLTALDQDVEIVIRRKPRLRRAGRITVLTTHCRTLP
jgi:predicted XRE-type DNA-binding protein